MFHKTSAIVLNTINYSDKYILASAYTDKFGKVTYMVPKSVSKKSKIQRKIFSPLSLLEIEAEHLPSRDIQRIKEARRIFPMYSVSTSMVKTSIVFFLSEFLSKVLKDTAEYKLVFEYLQDSLQILEECEDGLSNFHLVFIFKLTRFLGFYPNLENYQENDFFDMINGEFVHNQPLHNHYINRTDSKIFYIFERINFRNMSYFQYSRQDRIHIINRILEYYRVHLNDFQTIKSLDVLHELF